MDPECLDQLADGYEEALNSVSDLTDILSDLQDTLIDTLSALHGDVQALTAVLKGCLKTLQQIR